MKRPRTLDRLGYKSFYRRNLPHIQPLNTVLFLTFRLAGSLPKEVLAQMAEERSLLEKALKNDSATCQTRFRHLARRHFAMLESWLDKAPIGPTWLAEPRVAGIVAEGLHHRDGKKYRLDAYSIMPNHVHSVFAPLGQDTTPESLSSIMHSLKRNTAKRANQILGRSGSFWEHESFDHYIRNRAEWTRIVKYVLDNPVKAGLARTWEEWPWNYVRDPLAKPDAS
ncbi:MAG: REP-associated tyrosine transposase [Blastocatellia bacterium]|nr:REP-associated tyrosine transposase [Blastocatellia bacterium]